MKPLYYFLLLSFLFLFGFSQTKNTIITPKESNYIPYFLKVYEADSLFLTDNYHRSYEILDSLFQKYEPKNTELIYEYETYIKAAFLIGETNQLDVKFEKLIKDFGFTKEWFSKDSTDILFKAFEFANISDDIYGIWRYQYVSKIDLEMRETVTSMIYYSRYYQKIFDEADSIKKKREELVEIHKNILMDWFDLGIYPNQDMVGNSSLDQKATYDLTGIFMQMDEATLDQYFLPKIMNFVKKGECSPNVYARIIDAKSPESIYGEIMILKENIDYSKYNVERRKIGLPSMEYLRWKPFYIMESYKLN